MKKILLFIALTVSLASLAQRKISASSSYNFDESGSIDYLDSSAYSYIDYQGSVMSFGPVFGMDEASPIFWYWRSPNPSFTTSANYTNNILGYTMAKLYNGAHQALSATSDGGWRILNTYTGSGKKASEVIQMDLGGGNWGNNDSISYTYDASDRLIIQNRYNFPSGFAVISNTDTLGYVGVTNNVNRLISFNSPDGIVFEANQLMEYTYSGNNPLTLKYSADDDGDPLTPLVWLVQADYNWTGANLTSFVGMLVAGGIPTSTEAIRIDYTYNFGGKLLTLNQTGMFGLIGYNFVYDPENYVTKATYFEETTAGGSLYTREEEYIYYQSTADLEAVESIDFTVYPNPSSDLITFTSDEKVESISIYSMDGKKLISQTGNNVVTISSLSNGNYLLEVSTANGSSRKTISKN